VRPPEMTASAALRSSRRPSRGGRFPASCLPAQRIVASSPRALPVAKTRAGSLVAVLPCFHAAAGIAPGGFGGSGDWGRRVVACGGPWSGCRWGVAVAVGRSAGVVGATALPDDPVGCRSRRGVLRWSVVVAGFVVARENAELESQWKGPYLRGFPASWAFGNPQLTTFRCAKPRVLPTDIGQSGSLRYTARGR
jgi:hypothetical protein